MSPRASFRVLSAALLALGLGPARVLAHCDTLDGPVVRDARAALESRQPGLALKWVGPEKEGEVREAYERALAVRVLSPGARDLADRYFFETLVRVHREGEGAPYTGLKPEGSRVEPAIAASDEALEKGSADALVAMVTAAAERGLRTRFARAVEARKHTAEGVERGRDYVAAYVELVHYAERLHGDAAGGGLPAGHEGARAGASPHH
jgi:uncharacterized protein DUF6448